jgi:hypothetical protein
MLHIHENDGQAISGLNGDQHTGNIRYQSIAGKWLLGDVVDAMNYVGMNLPKCDQGPQLAFRIHRAQTLEKCSSIALNGCNGVLLSVAEIQAIAAVSLGPASRARAESMNQPRNSVQGLCTEDLNFARFLFPHGSDWHNIILPRM